MFAGVGISLALLGTFAVDLYTPLGVAAWAPYLILISATVTWHSRPITLAITILSCLLAAIGGILSPPGEMLPIVNRTLGIGLLLLCGLLCTHQVNMFEGWQREKTAHQQQVDRYRSLVRAIPQVVWTTDAQGNVVEDSLSWREFSGQSREQYLGWGWLTALHPDDRERTRDIWSRSVAQRIIYETEYRLRWRDGSYRHVLVRGVPVLELDGRIREWVGTCTDITDRKKTEDALHRSESLLRAVIEGTTDAVFVKDTQGRYLLINTAGANLVGKTVAAILGQNDTALFSPDTAQGIMAHDQLLMKSRQIQTFEEEGEAAGVRRVYLATKGPYLDGHGNLLGLVGISRDISERKQIAKLLAQHAADLARSNADLEQFAYAASHDLQEPLRMISSYLELLAQRYQGQLDGTAQRWMTYAVDGAAHMRRLISDLLDYSRVGRLGRPFTTTDCGQTLRTVLSNLQRLIAETGAVVEMDALPVLQADPSQLTQLFQNLLENAIKYRSDHPPRLRVAAQRQQSGWLFSVKDNGIGIAPEYAERIFLIFQRLHTRAEYPGTGIGLAICQRIVERHGGRIWVESQVGQGATFYFLLPVESEDSHAA